MKKRIDQLPVICHVIHSFSHIGGAENVIIHLLNQIPANSVKQIVCSLTDIGEIKNRVKNPDVVFYEINKKEGNDLSLPYKLFKIFRTEQVSVVHLRGWATLLEGYIAAKFAGVGRVIYSEHGRHFLDVWNGKRINILVKRYLFSKVDRLLTVSSSLKYEMKDLYSIKRNINVIRNGVDTNKFDLAVSRNSIRRKFNWTVDEFIIGAVGRLHPGKGVEKLVTNFCNSGISARLIIVGDGELRSNVERLVKQNDCDDRVTLLGSRDDVPDLLNCFDVFVQPSESEGLSNVILEAMSSRLPVICFDVGGNSEMITDGKSGFLIRPESWEEFIIKLKQLSQDKNLCASFSEFNRKRIEADFGISGMVEKYLSLYFDEETLD